MRKQIYKLMFPLTQLYWFVFRPKSQGAKCIIEHDSKLLMVKNSYGKQRYTFPGGGIKRGETPEQAVVREVKEEVGIYITSPELLGSFCNNWEHKRDTVFVFKATVEKPDFKMNVDELEVANWFSKDNLPPLGPIAMRMLEFYKK